MTMPATSDINDTMTTVKMSTSSMIHANPYTNNQCSTRVAIDPPALGVASGNNQYYNNGTNNTTTSALPAASNLDIESVNSEKIRVDQILPWACIFRQQKRQKKVSRPVVLVEAAAGTVSPAVGVLAREMLERQPLLDQFDNVRRHQTRHVRTAGLRGLSISVYLDCSHEGSVSSVGSSSSSSSISTSNASKSCGPDATTITFTCVYYSSRLRLIDVKLFLEELVSSSNIMDIKDAWKYAGEYTYQSKLLSVVLKHMKEFSYKGRMAATDASLCVANDVFEANRYVVDEVGPKPAMYKSIANDVATVAQTSTVKEEHKESNDLVKNNKKSTLDEDNVNITSSTISTTITSASNSACMTVSSAENDSGSSATLPYFSMSGGTGTSPSYGPCSLVVSSDSSGSSPFCQSKLRQKSHDDTVSSMEGDHSSLFPTSVSTPTSFITSHTESSISDKIHKLINQLPPLDNVKANESVTKPEKVVDMLLDKGESKGMTTTTDQSDSETTIDEDRIVDEIDALINESKKTDELHIVHVYSDVHVEKELFDDEFSLLTDHDHDTYHGRVLTVPPSIPDKLDDDDDEKFKHRRRPIFGCFFCPILQPRSSAFV